MKKLIIMVASLALVAGFALTAAAADWNFYGSARVNTFWTNTETISVSGSDVDDFDAGLHVNARIGATVKVNDELTGGFEYGANEGNANIRLLFGEWNFGAGKLLIGQHYTPLNWFPSNQVYKDDYDLLGIGSVYSGRQPMIQFTFGGLKLAFTNVDDAQDAIGTDDEVSLPAVEASYSFAFNPINGVIAGGFQRYESTLNGIEYDIDSYLLALLLQADLGNVFIKWDGYYGQNPAGLIAIHNANGATASLPQLDGTTLQDVDGVGFIVVLGYKVNDQFTLEAGYGFAETELDNAVSSNEVASYYANATITFAPGVFIVPEIGIIDEEEALEEEIKYIGAKWQINF